VARKEWRKSEETFAKDLNKAAQLANAAALGLTSVIKEAKKEAHEEKKAKRTKREQELCWNDRAHKSCSLVPICRFRYTQTITPRLTPFSTR
jgi:hypothetical protein